MKRILLPPRSKAMEGERRRRGSKTGAQAGARPGSLAFVRFRLRNPGLCAPGRQTQNAPCGPHLGAQGLLLQIPSPTVCASRRSGEKSMRGLLPETQATGGLGARVPHALVGFGSQDPGSAASIFPHSLSVQPDTATKGQFLKQA